MRVAVIGVGGVGSAAARFLAAAGHDVVGYERFRIGHDLGSSHGESRLIRSAYPDPLYAGLVGEATRLWEETAALAGEELFVRSGGLFFGPREHPDLAAVRGALDAAGLAYEVVGPDAALERFPAFRLRAGEVGLYQSESGFLRATRCVLATAALARRDGATLLEETEVSEVTPRGAEVIVRAVGRGAVRGGMPDATRGATSGAMPAAAPAAEQVAERAFDRVVVTAGPWMGALLRRFDLPLTVTRQEVVYLRIARRAEQFAPAALPIWIDAATYNYGCPADGRIDGVKVGAHRGGVATDPDRVDRAPRAEHGRTLAAYARERMPDLSGEAVRSDVCLYTNTTDEDFVIDRAPDSPNVWIVSACSGHGFKFAALIGKLVAELATGAAAPPPWLSRFALRRFK